MKIPLATLREMSTEDLDTLYQEHTKLCHSAVGRSAILASVELCNRINTVLVERLKRG